MKDFDSYLRDIGEVGYVQSVMSSIFYVSGLPNARLNELVLTENGLIGIVKSVLPDLVEVMIFEGQTLIHNMKVVRTNEYFQVPVSDAFLGRVIDPFGLPQDGKEPILSSKITYRDFEGEAPKIGRRVRVNRHMATGVMAVDMQFPLGLGQRELILGDSKTGKTTFCLQAMVAQVKMGAIGVYVICGKKKSDVKFVQSYLESAKVLDRVVIVSATSSDPAPMVYLAPFSGITIAEHFRDQNHNVLVVFDDMTSHAKFYRELSLLAKRPPGRQSYPGDIFHLHARICERAGNIRLESGQEVAITLLPIAETLESDLAGYIQTNLMAMTDGHIFLDTIEAKRGRMPAVSFTLSVSRVGNQTKAQVERELSSILTLILAEARKAEELGKFGVELTEETMRAVSDSEKIEALFRQEATEKFDRVVQLILAGLFISNFWTATTSAQIKKDKKAILGLFERGLLKTLIKLIEGAKNSKDLVAILVRESKALRVLIDKQVAKNEYQDSN